MSLSKINNQKQINILQKYLQKNNLKSSETRVDILKFFLKLNTHISAEELYNKIAKKISNIGLSTVYRNLKLFCKANLAQELKLNDGIVRYESIIPNEHHDHLICINCNRILEVFDQNIEKLQEKIAKNNNFILKSHKLDLYGICNKCQKK